MSVQRFLRVLPTLIGACAVIFLLTWLMGLLTYSTDSPAAETARRAECRHNLTRLKETLEATETLATPENSERIREVIADLQIRCPSGISRGEPGNYQVVVRGSEVVVTEPRSYHNYEGREEELKHVRHELSGGQVRQIECEGSVP